MYSGRIAYVDHSRTAYIFGGVCTYIHSLLRCCDYLGVHLDICTDIDITSRVKWIPPEIYQSLVGHTFSGSHIVYSRSPHSAYSSMEAALAVEAFFQQLRYKVYDVVIFGTISCLEAALQSGLRHPNVYLYLHQHELFNEMPFSGVVPDWYANRCKVSLKFLPIRGVITQHDSNIPMIKESTGVATVIAIPITPPPKCKVNYASKRSGIAFLGSGERLKNPELAIEIFNAVRHPVHFYVGRGSGRLQKLLKGVEFCYYIHEKLSYTELYNELSKRLCGVHCAFVEGYGMSVVEQMHYYPVLLWGGGNYTKHFPTGLVFATPHEAAKIIDRLAHDKGYWNRCVEENERYLANLHVSAVSEKYKSLFQSPIGTTKAYTKVLELGSCSYGSALQYLGWTDPILAANYSVKWPIKRVDDRLNTYFVGDTKVEPTNDGRLF